MPYPPRSPRWCLICRREAGDVVLFPVYLMRPYLDPAGHKRTRSIPTRICAACAAQLIADFEVSSGKRRDTLLEPSRRPPARARDAHGRLASRAATLDGSVAAVGRDA